MAKSETKGEALHLMQLKTDTLTFRIVGLTPIILNRMSEKVLRELLLPRGKRTAADKASTLKHDPYQEFMDSPYVDQDPKGPTYLQHLVSAFKRGMANAALDVPGSSKAQIGRLMWVNGERFSLYGMPKMLMSVVRSADMNRTPDVRTRVIVPRWACEIAVSYAVPLLNATSVANLLGAAGVFQGIGDWRPEKGKGTYGQYRFVEKTDKDWNLIVKTGGRKVQQDAMKEPDFYDEETEQLYRWFQGEVVRRGRAPSRNGEPVPVPAGVHVEDEDGEETE